MYHMNMHRRFVIDTCSLINYFGCIFGEDRKLSTNTCRIIDDAFDNDADVYLSIPAIVFVEIYDKWITTPEFGRKFYYEVYKPIVESNHIEIKPLEKEVLYHLVLLDGIMSSHDIHDKIVLASAIMLECSLITYDPKLVKYAKKTRVIPKVIY